MDLKDVANRVGLLATRVQDLSEVAHVNTIKIIVLSEVSTQVRHSNASQLLKNSIYEALLCALDQNDPEFWKPFIKRSLAQSVEQFAKWAEDGTLLPKPSKTEGSKLAQYLVSAEERKGRAKKGAA